MVTVVLAGNRGVWTGSTVGRVRIQLCRGHVGRCWTPSGVYTGSGRPVAHVAEGPWERREDEEAAREGRGEWKAGKGTESTREDTVEENGVGGG